MLIDEADVVLLDNACTLPNKYVIGLSATCVDASPIEKTFLLRTKFHCVLSKIHGEIDEYSICKASVEDFIAKSADYGKLVFLRR